jgi:hypothetical protein
VDNNGRRRDGDGECKALETESADAIASGKKWDIHSRQDDGLILCPSSRMLPGSHAELLIEDAHKLGTGSTCARVHHNGRGGI